MDDLYAELAAVRTLLEDADRNIKLNRRVLALLDQVEQRLTPRVHSWHTGYGDYRRAMWPVTRIPGE